MADHDDYNHALANERHQQIMQRLALIHEQTTLTNGRLRTVESKVAVLEERSPGKHGAAGAAIGGALTAAALAALEYLKR